MAFANNWANVPQNPFTSRTGRVLTAQELAQLDALNRQIMKDEDNVVLLDQRSRLLDSTPTYSQAYLGLINLGQKGTQAKEYFQPVIDSQLAKDDYSYYILGKQVNYQWVYLAVGAAVLYFAAYKN